MQCIKVKKSPTQEPGYHLVPTGHPNSLGGCSLEPTDTIESVFDHTHRRCLWSVGDTAALEEIEDYVNPWYWPLRFAGWPRLGQATKRFTHIPYVNSFSIDGMVPLRASNKIAAIVEDSNIVWRVGTLYKIKSIKEDEDHWILELEEL